MVTLLVRVTLLAGLVALLVSLGSATTSAHDIPNDVTVHVFVKPEAQRLRLLVRVPLLAMRDMDYPKPRGTTNADLLDLGRADQTLRDAATLWVGDFLDLYENDQKLPAPGVTAVRASLQADTSFASYEEALAHVTGPPLNPSTEYFWSQGMLDVLFETPVQSDRSLFAIQPRLARLGIRTLTVLRFLPPGGAIRAFEFQGDPGFVRLDPRWHQAALQFVKLGFTHILDGMDHLLFIFCLVIPFRRFRALVAVVTAFTVAHSMTMFASAYNLAPDALWFPPLVETLIATSIVYLALENIIGTQGTQSTSLRRQIEPTASAWQAPGTPKLVNLVTSEGGFKRRWLVAFAFGLVHGFGFSFGLRQTLQFAGSHLLASLLSFNVGVELGQLLVLVVLIPALGLLFRRLVFEQVGTIILSALVAHTAWHWLTERWAILRQFRFEWPPLDALFWASAMRWMMLAVVAGALYWFVFHVLKLQRETSAPERTLHHGGQ